MGTNKVQASLKGWSASNPNSQPIPSSSPAGPSLIGRAFFMRSYQPGFFRTFRASAAALASLTKRNGHDSKRSRTKAIIDAADEASEILANTLSRDRATFIRASSKRTKRES